MKGKFWITVFLAFMKIFPCIEPSDVMCPFSVVMWMLWLLRPRLFTSPFSVSTFTSSDSICEILSRPSSINFTSRSVRIINWIRKGNWGNTFQTFYDTLLSFVTILCQKKKKTIKIITTYTLWAYGTKAYWVIGLPMCELYIYVLHIWFIMFIFMPCIYS